MKFSLWGLMAVVLCYSCGDSTTIGADLFDGEEIEVKFRDSFDIKAKTIALDSFNSVGDQLLLGSLDDEIFGKTLAECFVRVDTFLGSRFTEDNPVPESIDSMLLIMGLSRVGNYGDTTSRNLSLHVFQVEDDLPSGIEFPYYSTTEVNVNESPIGAVSNYLLNWDSLIIFNPISDTLETTVPQIRIPLNDEFLTWFQQEVLDADADIRDVLKGFRITPSEENGLMTSVDLRAGAESGARFRMFYSVADTAKIYDYMLSGPAFNLIQTDPSGTDVSQSLDSAEIGDSILYLQPCQGTQIEVDLSDIQSLEDAIINEVSISMTVAEDNVGDIRKFSPISSIKASVRDENGVLVDIKDVPLSISSFEQFFGGTLTTNEDLDVMQYEMNITQFVKNNINNSEFPPLIIGGFFEGQISNRSVIFGPGHGLYPMKINVTYTLP